MKTKTVERKTFPMSIRLPRVAAEEWAVFQMKCKMEGATMGATVVKMIEKIAQGDSELLKRILS
jgi:hypothetical protein